MALTMRQPFRLTSSLAAVSKIAFKPSTPIRTFHSSRPASSKFFTSRTSTPISTFTKTRNAFRAYQQPSAAPPAGGSLTQRLLVGGAILGGTWLAVDLVFNRETREDGAMPPFERAYLNDTFLHTGLGIGIIALSARAMFQSGFVYRMMATNPWVVMGGGLALSIGTMMGTRATDPSK